MLQCSGAHAEEVLKRLEISSCSDGLTHESGDLIRQMPGRETWRVESGGQFFFLKKYGLPSIMRRFSKLSPAKVEYLRHWELADAGFAVPEAMAFGEYQRFGGIIGSFLLTQSVGEQTLLSRLEDGEVPGLDWWLELADMLKAFHSLGYYHRDFYANHLHFGDGVGSDWPPPYILDLQRVVKKPKPRRRWLVKDLAGLRFSCRNYLSDDFHQQFLLHYLGKSKVDREFAIWDKKVQAKADFMAKHVPKYP